MDAITRIALERKEQVEKHGFTAQHDDLFDGAQLEDAARAVLNEDPDQWPKGMNSELFFRASEKPTRERLVVAAALLVAEIDRIDRALARTRIAEEPAKA